MDCRLFNVEQNLISLALMAFVATLQFLPDWLAPSSGHARRGFIAGLVAGFTVWFLTLMMPLIYDIVIAKFTLSIPRLAGEVVLGQRRKAVACGQFDRLHRVLPRLSSRGEEANAAAECMSNSITRNSAANSLLRAYGNFRKSWQPQSVQAAQNTPSTERYGTWRSGRFRMSDALARSATRWRPISPGFSDRRLHIASCRGCRTTGQHAANL